MLKVCTGNPIPRPSDKLHAIQDAWDAISNLLIIKEDNIRPCHVWDILHWLYTGCKMWFQKLLVPRYTDTYILQ